MTAVLKPTDMGPRCPNHGVRLVDCRNGIGICPVSTARFTYQADEQQRKRKLRLTAIGKYIEEYDWEVKNIDGESSG